MLFLCFLRTYAQRVDVRVCGCEVWQSPWQSSDLCMCACERACVHSCVGVCKLVVRIDVLQVFLVFLRHGELVQIVYAMPELVPSKL